MEKLNSINGIKGEIGTSTVLMDRKNQKGDLEKNADTEIQIRDRRHSITLQIDMAEH